MSKRFLLRWFRKKPIHAFLEWKCRLLAVGLAYLLIAYAEPTKFFLNWSHWQSPETLFNECNWLQERVNEVNAELANTKNRHRTQAIGAAVDKVVARWVVYTEDRIAWGAKDYLPSIKEMVEQAQQNPDGKIHGA